MPNEMQEIMDAWMEMMGSVAILNTVSGVIGLVAYILGALGAYTIAKRRGINHPWLAWLPIGNVWIWGCIADQYRYVTRGEVKNRRKVLLTMQIIMAILTVVLVVQVVSMMVNIVLNLDALEYMSDSQVLRMVVAPALGIAAVGVVMAIVSIVYAVFLYIVLYDLYRSCDPELAVLFLVLSILFGNLTAFFIFGVRNKDVGMPPRVRPVVQQPYIPPQQESWQPPQQEPWQQPQETREPWQNPQE